MSQILILELLMSQNQNRAPIFVLLNIVINKWVNKKNFVSLCNILSEFNPVFD